MQDPIADMLTRIRNAQQAHSETVNIPSSKVKESIAKVLQDAGYVADFSNTKEGAKNILTITLKYYEGKPVIQSLKRISRPGLRIYRSSDKLPVVHGGLGESIISTPQGVMTGKQAKNQNLGGEVIAEVV